MDIVGLKLFWDVSMYSQNDFVYTTVFVLTFQNISQPMEFVKHKIYCMHHANLVQLILCFVLFKVKVHLVCVDVDVDGGGGSILIFKRAQVIC